MTTSIPLQLTPLKPGLERRREGTYGFYDTLFEELEFSILRLPTDAKPGLYRLTILTPDAVASGMSAELQVGRGGDRERLPIAVRVRPNRMDIFFVRHGDEQDPVLTVTSKETDTIRIGPASIERVSTTMWRTMNLLGWLGALAAKPRGVVAYAQAVADGYRQSGLSGARLGAIHAYHGSIWSQRRLFDQRIKQVVRQTSITNARLLAEMQLSKVRAAASLSIVVPVFRTPKTWLAQLVGSLQDQTEKDFEAIFVLDGPQPETAAELASLLSGMPSCRMIALPENQGVAAATNAGLRSASGDFILCVDHDDVLQRHLVEAFQTASGCEDADLYFADEAITDEKMQNVHHVASRGQFDIRYYLSHPYIVHPIFIRRALALAVGLLDERLKISQDVEFFLRCVSKAASIAHIPLILYFWRTHSASLGHVSADNVYENTSKAVRNYLSKTTGWTDVDVRPGINFNELDVRPPVVAGAKVAIVIPTRNGYDILQKCLISIYSRAELNSTPATIIVINHQSDDLKTLSFLSEEKRNGRIEVFDYTGPWNYSEINNAGIREKVSGRDYSHLVLMNNDIELVTDDWLDRMISQFSWGDVGVVGCCLTYPNGQIQHAGVGVGLSDAADHVHRFEEFRQFAGGPRSPGYLCSLVATRDFSAVTGALMMVSLELFEAVGGLDESLAIGFNDTDLCLRIGQRGYRTTYVGSVVAVHDESITRKLNEGIDHPEDTERFQARYANIITNGDPYLGAQWDWGKMELPSSSVPQKNLGLRVVNLWRAIDAKAAGDLVEFSRDTA